MQVARDSFVNEPVRYSIVDLTRKQLCAICDALMEADMLQELRVKIDSKLMAFNDGEEGA